VNPEGQVGRGASPRPRQRDIAELAGVDRSTVSVVLAGKAVERHIPPATRDRVLEVARKLGYRSDPIARRLKGMSGRIIGIHTYGRDMTFAEGNYNYEYLPAAQRAATQRGYDVLLFTSTTHEEETSSAFQGGSNRLAVADGSLIIGFRDDHAELARLWSEGYPFVRIDRRDVPGADIPWVDSDHVTGTIAMVHELRKAGYHRLLYVGSPRPLEPFADRQEGFRQAMGRYGLPASSMHLLEDDDITADWLRSVSRRGAPTIIAERHNHAEFVTDAARALHVRTPIAVLQSPFPPVDRDLHCAYFVEPRVEIAREAIDMLVSTIEGGPLRRSHLSLPGTVRVQPAAKFAARRRSWSADA